MSLTPEAERKIRQHREDLARALEMVTAMSNEQLIMFALHNLVVGLSYMPEEVRIATARTLEMRAVQR